jgi:hypothetical protein
VTHVIATGSIAVSDVSYFYNLIAAAGVAGVWVLAFLFDWVVTKKVYEKSIAERDSWRELYEHERDAHADTRDALVLASQRAEAGVEAAKVTKMLIDGLRAADKSSSSGA